MQLNKLILFFGLVMLAGNSFCQSTLIGGNISDAKTNEPLPLASVFINNTTFSTASQVDGQYILKNIPSGPIELVVSYVGYESSRTKLVVHDGDKLLLNVTLVPSVVELPNIQVKGEREKKWRAQYLRFEKIFLGENSTGAKIINPGVIDFKEQKNGKILLAEADEGIQIENPGLGYRIFYYLRKFQCDKDNYTIVGDMRFEYLKAPDDKKRTEWADKRKEIYSGSLRHLLVALINNKVSEEGFQLYVDLPESNADVRSSYFSMNKGVVPFKADSVVSPGERPGEFKIKFDQRVEVHYMNKVAEIKTYKDISCPVGWIEPTKGYIEVDAEGVLVNLADLITSGYLSDGRIASLLPNNYQP